MLHIHCGDISADTLRKSGVPGEVTVWMDLLVEGPAGVEDKGFAGTGVKKRPGGGGGSGPQT